VNPAHLFLGTQADNVHDAVQKGRIRKGARCTQSRLSDDDVHYIRSRSAHGGMTQQALAQQFGVAQTTIHRVIHRATWAHLP
jgi:uncharacterized membrane protein